MARHLRGDRRPRRRTVLALVGTLVLGLVLGVGGSLLLEDAPTRVDSGPQERGADDDGPEGTATLEPDAGPITIAFVGDVRADGPLAARLADSPDDFVGPFAEVLRDADLAVAGLDAVIATGAAPAGGAVAPPAILDALAAGGIDVVSAANEHVLDLGPEGLDEMVAVREARSDGMVIGVGADETEAYAPFVREVGGHTVAVIAATQVLDADDIAAATAGPGTPGVASAKRVDRLVAEVEAARDTADTVVVVLQWGIEGETCPSPGQEELAAALVEAGADVVTGAGAEWTQGTGRLGDPLVGYGLGTFLVDGREADETGVLLVEIDDRRVVGYRWAPGRLAGGVPQPLMGDDADVAVANWEFRRTCTDLTP